MSADGIVDLYAEAERLHDELQAMEARALAAEAARDEVSTSLWHETEDRDRWRTVAKAAEAALAERDATLERVRALADSWVAADGEPATAADLTAMNVLNRCGRRVRAALESR